MKKILWFSRHKMTPEQKLALGDVEIMQINKTINSAYELKDEIDECDIIAIVAPINLQQQFLKLAEGKPVIMAVSCLSVVYFSSISFFLFADISFPSISCFFISFTLNPSGRNKTIRNSCSF